MIEVRKLPGVSTQGPVGDVERGGGWRGGEGALTAIKQERFSIGYSGRLSHCFFPRLLIFFVFGFSSFLQLCFSADKRTASPLDLVSPFLGCHATLRDSPKNGCEATGPWRYFTVKLSRIGPSNYFSQLQCL